MLAHYAVVADPARVADPNRKGCVESAIQHTQGTTLAGRHFETLEAQNEFLSIARQSYWLHQLAGRLEAVAR